MTPTIALRTHLAAAILVLASTLASPAIAQWTDVPLCTQLGDQGYSAMVSDGLGGAVVVWYDNRSNPGSYLSSDIYAQRIDANGAVQWAADGVPVCTATGYQGEPHVVQDGAGGFVIVWTDARSGATRIYAQRLTASGVPQWATNGIKVSTDSSSAGNIDVASDGAGGAVVVWHGFDSPRGVWAQRVTVAGSTWGADVPICRLLQREIRPFVAPDGSGGWAVVWPDDRVAGQFDLYAQRLNAAGVPQWAANGIAVCTSHFVRRPAVISNSPGDVIVAWNDGRGGNAQIYGQRLNSSGASQWTPNGVLLSTTTTGDPWGGPPKIVNDASDGAIVAWDDGYAGTQAHAQRVSGTGALLWSSAGQVLWPAATAADVEATVSDQAGGAIVLGETNLGPWGQRIDAAGNLAWGADGVPLSWLSQSNFVPAAVPDGAGGAVFDLSVTQPNPTDYNRDDLYAGRVGHNGTVDVPAIRGPEWPELAITGAWPNPSAGKISMRLTLLSDAPVSVDLIDTQGRRRLAESLTPEGRQFSMTLDGRGHLAPGVYFLRVTQAGQTAARRICVVH